MDHDGLIYNNHLLVDLDQLIVDHVPNLYAY